MYVPTIQQNHPYRWQTWTLVKPAPTWNKWRGGAGCGVSLEFSLWSKCVYKTSGLRGQLFHILKCIGSIRTPDRIFHPQMIFRPTSMMQVHYEKLGYAFSPPSHLTLIFSVEMVTLRTFH